MARSRSRRFAEYFGREMASPKHPEYDWFCGYFDAVAAQNVIYNLVTVPILLPVK